MTHPEQIKLRPKKTRKKKISSGVKTALELGPVLAFFVAYLWTQDDIYTVNGVEYGGFIVVTALFIPLMLACTGTLWWLTGKLSRMQVMTLVLVVVMGGLSVWLNDERFLKMKPTIVYGAFTLILGIGLLRGQSYLKVVMGDMLPMAKEGWMKLTRRVTVFFALMAASNEIVWRTQTTEFWVYFETFAMPVAFFAFFMAQSALFVDYATIGDDPEDIA